MTLTLSTHVALLTFYRTAVLSNLFEGFIFNKKINCKAPGGGGGVYFTNLFFLQGGSISVTKCDQDTAFKVFLYKRRGSYRVI